MDRNAYNAPKIDDGNRSLSARRAWIEIISRGASVWSVGVALRKESVDRNQGGLKGSAQKAGVALRKESVDRNGFLRGLPNEHLVALRKESVDRNPIDVLAVSALPESLSARRAWIEIYLPIE